MNIGEQIEKMRKIQCNILEFVDKEGDEEEHFENIIQLIEDQNISKNQHEMKTFLHLLSKILNNHFRYPNFISKIERIIQKYKKEITNNFTSYEIYKIFKKNRRILLFLFKEEIIKVDEYIFKEMPIDVFAYLSPIKAQRMKIIEKVPENFESKQKIGENDEIINEMIRKDMIEEFIIYVNKNEYSLKSEVKESIFETNDFLLKYKGVILIKYADFFWINTNIQIFI